MGIMHQKRLYVYGSIHAITILLKQALFQSGCVFPTEAPAMKPRRVLQRVELGSGASLLFLVQSHANKSHQYLYQSWWASSRFFPHLMHTQERLDCASQSLTGFNKRLFLTHTTHPSTLGWWGGGPASCFLTQGPQLMRHHDCNINSHSRGNLEGEELSTGVHVARPNLQQVE